jgi:DNA-binding MarR family transcriptional regulator
MQDAVDKIIAQWKTEGVEDDLTPMETIGRIARLHTIIDKKLEATFALFGLNRGEFDVLATLRRSGEPYTLTPTELFDTLMVTSGTMTNRLANLEKRGLIARIKNDEDKRSTLVQLSATGFELINRCLTAHIRTEAEAVSGLSRKTLEQLNNILKEFEKTL